MRITKVFATLALIAAGAGTVPYASASTVAGQAGGSVFLSYRLVDLDESDGITPWIQFSPTSQLAMSYTARPDEPQPVLTRPGGIFGAPATVFGSPDGLSQVQYSASGHGATVTLHADTFQPGATPSAWAGLAHFYGSDIDPVYGVALPFDGEYAFQLSPSTALIIEANAVLSASVNTSGLIGGAFQQQLIDSRLAGGIWASTYLDISFDADENYLVPDSWTEYGSLFGGLSLSANGVLSPDMEAQLDEQSLTDTAFATYYNGSNGVANVRFNYYFNAEVLSYFYDLPPVEPPYDPDWPPIDPPVDPGLPPVTPAIPEPSTYALMLLGLAGIAVAARQRRRQQAS